METEKKHEELFSYMESISWITSIRFKEIERGLLHGKSNIAATRNVYVLYRVMLHSTVYVVNRLFFYFFYCKIPSSQRIAYMTRQSTRV